ncbi:sugar phosphate isomerase/epimerase, partial [Marinobacter pelagius]|uniref:sugar phosphate isomerase/epimerase family protein n=1 Tax=Marinobacter sp. C7 TaxID=2951363 RepID=UPI001EF02853
PYFYPWPQRPSGLVEEAFGELAKRWKPILDVFDEAGVDVAYELHPGEDLHDGVTFERFLEGVGNHPRANILYDPSHFVLQALDYLAFIDIYHERIRAFHVKDAELQSSGRSGVYGGYQSWVDRPGRFRSLGDGAVRYSSALTHFVDFPWRYSAENGPAQVLRLAQQLANGADPHYYFMGTPDQPDRKPLPAVKSIFDFHREHEALYAALETAARVALYNSRKSRPYDR